MKLIVICALILTAMLPASAMPQCDPSVGLFNLVTNLTTWPCGFDEPEGGGPLTVYVVFNDLGRFGYHGATFRLIAQGGFTGVYIDETVDDGVVIGDTQNGIVMWTTNPGCRCGGGGHCHHILAEVQYMTSGTSTPCSEIRMVGYPGEELPGITDCLGLCHTHREVSLVLNPSMDPDGCGAMCTVPNNETTWGRVKSLYSE